MTDNPADEILTIKAIFTADDEVRSRAINDDLYLFQDGKGLTVAGESAAVERFLRAEGLWAISEDVAAKFGPVLGVGSAATRAGAEIAAGSARWLKLTEESAARLQKMGLRESAKTGLSTTVLRGKKGGQIGGFLDIAKDPGSLLNPATFAGIAGVMGQLALQQALAEINNKLTAVDEKATAILRNQKIGEIAQLNGARLSIQEAVTIRDTAGRVTADQWSTVQQEYGRIAVVQAQALGQLQQIAGDLGSTAKIGDLAKALRRPNKMYPSGCESSRTPAYCITRFRSSSWTGRSRPPRTTPTRSSAACTRPDRFEYGRSHRSPTRCSTA